MEGQQRIVDALDVRVLLQKDRNKLSCLVQNNIDGYGKNLQLSSVVSVSAREHYVNSEKHLNNESLKQINFIYRLVYST